MLPSQLVGTNQTMNCDYIIIKRNMPFFKKRRPSPPCRPGLSHQTPRQAGRKIIIWGESLKKDETGEIVGKDHNGIARVGFER